MFPPLSLEWRVWVDDAPGVELLATLRQRYCEGFRFVPFAAAAAGEIWLSD